jgi:aspartate 1-decarboxylase
MLKSKIHRATLTGVDHDYEGSITIDQNLLEKANIFPNEQVHVLNCDNGSRCITYTISAERGSGTVVLNGPAAHLGMKGERVIILSYCELNNDEAWECNPRIVLVDEKNEVAEIRQ